MKLAFDVQVQRAPLDPTTYGNDEHKGYVSLGGVTVFETLVSDPHSPGALREMKEEVARKFAEHLVRKM